jgi:hypothetical protein
MYEWAVGDGDEYGDNGCAVLFDCLPEEAGHYVMAYYSYKMESIISVSEPFEVNATLHGIVWYLGYRQQSVVGKFPLVFHGLLFTTIYVITWRSRVSLQQNLIVTM